MLWSIKKDDHHEDESERFEFEGKKTVTINSTFIMIEFRSLSWNNGWFPFDRSFNVQWYSFFSCKEDEDDDYHHPHNDDRSE